MKLFDLSGIVAIITGATGQLGTAFAETIAELGGHVVVVSRTETDCVNLAARLTEEYQEAVAVPTDITNPSDVTALVDEVRDEFGRLDVLVNNAYNGNLVPFEEMSVDQFWDGLDVALTGSFLTTRESIPLLREAGGSIINIASIYGITGPDHGIYGDSGLNSPVHYGIAKSGLIQFSRWLATRYAADGIRSNALTPGGIYNAELEDRPDYESVFVRSYEERTPLGRMGTPTDLKGAMAYLASDASQWVTGQNLVIDGGWTAW